MRKAHHHDPQTSLDAGYEVADMNAKIIVAFGIGLAVTIVVTIGIILGVNRTLDRRGPMNTTPASPLTQEMRTLPSGALLQTDPITERKQILAESRAKLSTFAIVDENPEMLRARIPIDLAIDLLAEGNLPYRQEPVTAKLEVKDPPAAQTETVEPAGNTLETNESATAGTAAVRSDAPFALEEAQEAGNTP